MVEVKGWWGQGGEVIRDGGGQGVGWWGRSGGCQGVKRSRVGVGGQGVGW